MSRLSFAAITLSLLVTAGSLGYAWQTHDRLAQAEAAQREAERRRAELAAELERANQARASAPVETIAAVAPAADNPIANAAELAAGQPGNPPPGAFRPGPGGREMPPELRRLSNLDRKTALDGRFAALFRKLNLSPADLERLKELLVEKQTTTMDVMNTARAEGLNPRQNRDDIRQLVNTLEAEADTAIRGLLGENGFQQYQEYERTLPQRNVANQLEQRLSYSSSPLSAYQTDQLVSALAAMNGSPSAQSTGPGRGGGAPIAITDDVISRSQGFLYPSQIEALRQLQQEQQARRQLQQQMRARNNPSAPTPGGG